MFWEILKPAASFCTRIALRAGIEWYWSMYSYTSRPMCALHVIFILIWGGHRNWIVRHVDWEAFSQSVTFEDFILLLSHDGEMNAVKPCWKQSLGYLDSHSTLENLIALK
jgi:hypothetical protein